MLDLGGDVLWVTSHDSAQLLFVSPSYEHVWGRSTESLYADPQAFLEAAHPEDRAALREAFALQLAGKPFAHQYRIVRPDGLIRWVLAPGYPILDPEGKPRWFIGLARDITEQTRDADRLELVSRATDEALWGWDLESETAWWSEANYQMFEYSQEVQPSYQTWIERVHPEDRSRVIESFTAALEGNANTWRDEYRIVSTGGTTIEVVDRASISRDDHGKALRIAGALVNVTELRRLQRQLHHAQHAQKVDAIGQLAAGIAHDFSNMLQAILLEVGLARQRAQDPRMDEHLDQVRTYATRAVGLARQLVLLSRRDAIQTRPFDLNGCVSNMARMFHRILGEDVAVEIDLAPAPLVVHGDLGMIEQVLLNLVINARDAMPAGGTLGIATSLVDIDAGRGRPAGTYACLLVRDTGRGIPTDMVARVFEPFFTTKKPGHGTGLGLATVHDIVEQHRGWIDVQSEVGVGTTFSTYLPTDAGPPGPLHR